MCSGCTNNLPGKRKRTDVDGASVLLNFEHLEASMYLFFTPATLAVLIIGFIQLREQFGSPR